jgi:hypothetical protein
MKQECTTSAARTRTREAETMATQIRNMFEGYGWTVEGLPDDLTPAQGVEFLEKFIGKLNEVTA